jgi:hypothetical protein
MNQELKDIIKTKCDAKCSNILLLYKEIAAGNRLFTLNTIFNIIENEFQTFKDAIIKEYNLKEDKLSLQFLRKTILDSVKVCISKMMMVIE